MLPLPRSRLSRARLRAATTALSRRGSILLFALLSARGSEARAASADSWGIPWNNPVSASLSTSVWNNWTVYQLQQRQAQGASGNASAPAASPPAAPGGTVFDESSLRFHASGSRLLLRALAKQIGQTPDQQEQMVTVLSALFQEFDKQAARLGMPNDLAFDLSYFLAQNAALFHGGADPKDGQFLELRATVVAAFSQSGGLGNLTDAQKQEFQEMLVAFTGLVYLGCQDAMKRGDQEGVRSYRRLAGLNLKAITHLEPERINFTDQGLTIRPEP